MEFSTLNESDLHRTLKTIYSEQYDGKTEVNLNGHIYDIVTASKEIIEIQTGNLAKLLPKILDTIQKGYKVRIVYPLVVTKTIETYKNSELISKRKSPKKGNTWSLLKEITGLYPVLLNKDFKLEVVYVETTEKRIKLDYPSQSDNNRRRFKKDWNKSNKKLDGILETKTFEKKQDYLDLLPCDLPETFSSKELKESYRLNKYPASAIQSVNLLLWIFSHMDIIEFTDIQNKRKYYKVK